MKKLGIASIALATLLAVSAFPNANTNDPQVENSIRHKIAMLPYYGVFDDISFEVNQGVVTLTGETIRPTVRTEAAQAVSQVAGVQRVVNNIEVLPLSSHDDRIRLGVLRAIFWEPALMRYSLPVVPSIHIIVKNGNVRLEQTGFTQFRDSADDTELFMESAEAGVSLVVGGTEYADAQSGFGTPGAV